MNLKLECIPVGWSRRKTKEAGLEAGLVYHVLRMISGRSRQKIYQNILQGKPGGELEKPEDIA